MDTEQIEITIAASRDGGIFGEWAASMIESHDLGNGDREILETLTGYGDTALGAMAALLHRATAAQGRAIIEQTTTAGQPATMKG